MPRLARARAVVAPPIPEPTTTTSLLISLTTAPAV